ncbi:reverse transcriptase domain-containing protein [Tanacetum coccineum]
MAQLLKHPTEVYEDSIVVPRKTRGRNFELKSRSASPMFKTSNSLDMTRSPHGPHPIFPTRITSYDEVPARPDEFRALPPPEFLRYVAGQRYVKAYFLIKKNQSPPAPTNLRKSRLRTVVYLLLAHSTNFVQKPPTTGNVYRDNIQEYVSQAAAANYNQGNTVVQPPAYQAPAYQAPAPQIQGVSKEDFQAYVKANDAVMRNMQTQGQNMQNQLTNLTDMLSKFVTSNTASTSGTLPSNTVTKHPKEDLKGITTRSGVAYKGPTIPITSSPKVMERETEVTKDTMPPTNNGSTEDVQPPVVPFFSSFSEEADSFLAIEDDPTSPKVDPKYYDPDGDILLFEAILNSDPSPPPPNQGNYFPETRKDLKICEANNEKSSVNEPPAVELKDLPPHLEYAFLEAIAWKLSDIKGIDLEFCTYKILMEEDYEPTVQHQRRVNPKIHDVIKKEVEKLLDAGLIYPISDSPWVSPVHCVPKKGGMTVVKNDENDLISTRLVTGWRVCIDYRKLNEATRKDHFPLPFMDQMLERLAGNQFYCFLDGFSGYFQIPIDPKDQEKTTFTCPYGTFAYRRMPFGLCNAPGTFQRCMMAIFHDMIEKTMEVFMDDFSVFGDSFSTCLSHLDKIRELRSIELKLTLSPSSLTDTVKENWPPIIFKLRNHQVKLETRKSLKQFPIETLGSVALRDDSTPWFADFTNYHAGNFIFNTRRGVQARSILCHSRKLAQWTHGGHHGAKISRQKGSLCGILLAFQIYRMPRVVKNVTRATDKGKISQRDEMPQNFIQVCEIFEVLGH